jgi:hypothetical protein
MDATASRGTDDFSPEFVDNRFVSLASGSGDQPQIYRSVRTYLKWCRRDCRAKDLRQQVLPGNCFIRRNIDNLSGVFFKWETIAGDCIDRRLFDKQNKNLECAYTPCPV